MCFGREEGTAAVLLVVACDGYRGHAFMAGKLV